MDEDLLHLARTWGGETNEGIAIGSLIPLQGIPAIEKKRGGICVTVLCNNTLVLLRQESDPAIYKSFQCKFHCRAFGGI